MTEWQMKIAYERKSGESWDSATPFVKELWESAWIAARQSGAIDTDERAETDRYFASREILSDLAALRRYSLEHHTCGKGRTSTTLNVPNELLARIDQLVRKD